MRSCLVRPITYWVVKAEDPKELVRRGYDLLSERYEQEFAADGKYQSWIAELCERLPAQAAVLDIGCGCGIPVARDLSDAGHRLTGIDISEVQIRRARVLVPGAAFMHGDVTTVEFAPASFDAVVAMYTLIHIPLEQQRLLLERIAAWLRPGGWFLGTMGHLAWTGTDSDWLGSGVAMWWSHADAATNRDWITRSGLIVQAEEFVPEGDSGHVLFWATSPDDGTESPASPHQTG